MKNNTTGSKCPNYKKCGGCSGETDYAAYLRRRQMEIRKLLSFYGKVEPIVAMEEPFGYRHKVHAVFGRGPKGRLICGNYQAGTHKIVSCETCHIEDTVSHELILAIRDLAEAFCLEPFNEDTGRGFLRHVQIRRGYVTGEILVTLVTASNSFPAKKLFIKSLLDMCPAITSIVLNINNRRTSMVLGEREQVLYGTGYITDKLCGLTYRISSRSFYQVNPSQTEKLYRKAIELASLSGKEAVLDTYCGIGTIGMTAASKAKTVLGVELNKDAVRDAICNVKTNHLKNVLIRQGDAGEFMNALAEEGASPDVVFMDPPRSGSNETFLNALVRMGPKRVVYVSCGPESLARDLKYLTGRGYQVNRICPVDMFPFTDHVEMVVLLSKLNTKQHIEIKVDMDELDLTSAESKATYEEIKEWVMDNYGFKVSQLNIAQTKDKCGFEKRKNYNKAKSEESRQPNTPKEKEDAIIAAFKHFQMISE